MQHRWPRSQVEREQLQTETDTLSLPPPIFFSRWSEFHLVENLNLFKHILEVRVGAAYQWSERMRDTYLFIYLGTGREGEREREKHQCLVAFHTLPLGTWPATQACALTGNRTGNLLVCSLALNLLSHTSHGNKGHLKMN